MFSGFYWLVSSSWVTVKCVDFLWWRVVGPLPNPQLEDHPLSAVRDCLFSIFKDTVPSWGLFPPSRTWWSAVMWWQGPTWYGFSPKPCFHCRSPPHSLPTSSSVIISTYVWCGLQVTQLFIMQWMSRYGLYSLWHFFRKLVQQITGVSVGSTENNRKGGESLKVFTHCTSLFLSLSGRQKRCAKNWKCLQSHLCWSIIKMAISTKTMTV